MTEPLGPTGRLASPATFVDIVSILSDGNPGAIAVMMHAVKHLPEPIAASFLLNIDRTGMTGHRLYLLVKEYARSIERAAALLTLVTETGLPTAEELWREVQRTPNEGPAPLLERALEVLPRFAPAYAGVDLRPPVRP